MTAIGTSLGELQNQIQNQREDLYILESILGQKSLEAFLGIIVIGKE